MPQHAKNPQHRFYFYPVSPPLDVFEWQSWPEYSVCIPGPLISYLLNVMRVYQWEGRVKTDNPAEAKAFVEAWSDLIARVGAAVECEEPMPYPIFRMNPLNSCQMQQSVDGGETWTTVLDTSACFVPAEPPPVPIFRPHPTLPRSMQQSLDNGETWTTVLDGTITFPSFPTIPTPPPMIRLRNNPSNVRQVQQSHNGGETWTLAFTFPATTEQSVGDTIYISNVLEQNLTNITNTYVTNNRTVASIAPNLVFNGIEEEDDVRDILLCWAAREVVRLSCEMVIEARNRDAIGMSVASFVLTVVGAVIAATGSVGTGGFGTPFFVALGGAVAGLSATLWAGISNEQLSNEDVRETVACCMYNALKGATPEKSAFVNSLSGCDFAAGTVEAQMAGAIAASLDSDEMHASWQDYAQQNYRAAQLGLPSACPCEDEEEPGGPSDYDFVTVNGYQPTDEFINRAGDVESHKIYTVVLANTYYYAEMIDTAGKPFRVVGVTLHSGGFYQWSCAKYGGGVFSNTTNINSIIGQELARFGYYGLPGTQSVFTLQIEPL